MSTDPIPSPPSPTKANKLAVLLDALGGVAISDGERASLAWPAGFGTCTRIIAALITCARQTR